MSDVADAPANGTVVAPTGDTAAERASKAANGVKPVDMHIKVSSPFKVYFDGQADSISGLNDTGPFDILTGHSNFMTLVSACELVIRNKEGEQKIKIARAVMHVKADEINVFLDV